MTGVVFVSVSDFSRTATKVIREMEQGSYTVAITKLGNPVALLQKAMGKERGTRETVSNLRNKAVATIAELERTGKRLIITRDEEPVAVLSKVTENAFRAKK